jgi:hypothetical protein
MSGPAVTYIASLIQSLFHRSTVLWLIREVHACRAAEGGEACHSAQEQHTSRSMLTSGTGENGYLADDLHRVNALIAGRGTLRSCPRKRSETGSRRPAPDDGWMRTTSLGEELRALQQWETEEIARVQRFQKR